MKYIFDYCLSMFVFLYLPTVFVIPYLFTVFVIPYCLTIFGCSLLLAACLDLFFPYCLSVSQHICLHILFNYYLFIFIISYCCLGYIRVDIRITAFLYSFFLTYSFLYSDYHLTLFVYIFS